MAYHPVPETPRVCAYCNRVYYAKDVRRMYCTSTCNTKAWMARRKAQKGTQETLTPLVEGNPSSTAKDVGISILGSGVSATANYLLNDRPAQKEILAKLAEMEQGIELGLKQILQVAQYNLDFINAMKQAQPGLQLQIDQIQRNHLLEAANRKQHGDAIKATVLNKKQLKKG